MKGFDMTFADERDFDKTSGERADNFLSITQQPVRNWIPKEDDEVTLKYKGKSILLCDVAIHSHDYLSGEIRGIGVYSAYEVDGLIIGRRISFRNVHVFGLTVAS
tara:strand:- start:4414 stop:4728 length:315 start_codon:yes stop_codon:yes gene_type:complete